MGEVVGEVDAVGLGNVMGQLVSQSVSQLGVNVIGEVSSLI